MFQKPGYATSSHIWVVPSRATPWTDKQFQFFCKRLEIWEEVIGTVAQQSEFSAKSGYTLGGYGEPP